MRPPLPVVRLATFEDAEPIADLLADAFLDYEWSRWAVPADDRRERSAASICSMPGWSAPRRAAPG
jgi:hypothetical protein